MNKTTLTMALALQAAVLSAANPFLPLWEYIPDGEPYVFEDPDHPGQYRVYVYGSHDMLIQSYCGLDQVVWSAPVHDLSQWRYDGIIFESKLDAKGQQLHEDGKGDVLFAPDVTMTRDASGRPTYYLYPNNQAGGRNPMVARSSRPDGPFEVINWDANESWKNVGILAFDPAVFVDDDGRVYGYWGFENSNGAELDPTTMATVKPGTEIVRDMVSGRYQEGDFHFFEASSMRKVKDKYIFIFSRWTPNGEEGLPDTNYTLAYAYSNNPLGPFTYGGTIIDGRGKETRPDGSKVITAAMTGNTHGSICEIAGQWYVFYHRQCGTDEYSRQAMVEPINVEVTEGPNGYVRISEAEYTSQGFQIDGLDPYQSYAAGIACYYTHPEPQVREYPNIAYPGAYPQPFRTTYDGKTPPYDPSINRCPMVHCTSGSAVGYKYFNFSKTYGREGLKLNLEYTPEGVAGRIDVYVDRPSATEGGKLIGSLSVEDKASKAPVKATIAVEDLKQNWGKHALFLVFSSPTEHQSICTLERLSFK